MGMPDSNTAELARYESRDMTSDAFDEFDPMHVGAVVPADLVKPVMELLSTLWQAEATGGSFGLDKSAAWDLVMPDLKEFRRCLILRWKDL